MIRQLLQNAVYSCIQYAVRWYFMRKRTMTLTPGESCVRQTELVNPLDIIVHCNAKPLEFNYAHCWARTNFQCGATGSLRTVQSLMYIIGGKQGLPAVFPIRSKGKLVLDSNLADRCAELNFLISGWIFFLLFIRSLAVIFQSLGRSTLRISS